MTGSIITSDPLADLLGPSKVSPTQQRSPVPAASKRTLPDTVHESELCEVLGITRQRIGELVRNGTIYRVGRTQFDLRDTVQRYTANLRSVAARQPKGEQADELKAAKLELTKAQARRAAIIADKDAGKLLDAIAVEKEWAAVLRDVRAGMMAVPRLQTH